MREALVATLPAGIAVAAAAGLDSADLAALQRRRLADLLHHARAEVPHWRQTLAGLDLDTVPLQALPVLRKATLMDRFSSFVADPALSLPALRHFTADPALIGEAFGGRYAVWESSGSRGEPGLFVHDPGALAVYDALEAQRPAALRPLQRMLDPFWVAERVAFVGAIDGHFASVATLQRLRLRSPWMAAQWQGFSILQPLPALLQALERFAPSVLTTYPTAAAMLAEAQAEGRLHIHPAEIWTGGETLGSAQRTRIVQALGCPLRHSYGASEFLPIAAECRYNALHVNADWVILEPVDVQGQPTPEGELSHDTLLTNLANRVQPLIRYALGDRIRLRPGRCACGSALPVVEVQGRCDDLLVLAGMHQTPARLLPLAVSTLLEEEAGLYDFRLEQTGPSALSLHLPGPHTARADRAMHALKAYANSQGARPVTVTLHCGRPLPRGRSGKLQRIQGQPPKRSSR